MIPLETLREMEALRQRVEELEYELDLLKSNVEAELTRLMDYFDLTVNEARIIRSLAHAHGAPLSRSVLTEVLSGDVDYLRTIDSHIKRIRKKKACAQELPIDTLYGLGYRLLPETAKRVRAIMEGHIAPPQHRAHLYLTEEAA